MSKRLNTFVTIIAAVCILVGVGSVYFFGLPNWNVMSGMLKDTHKGQAEYTVEASGANIRVYEHDSVSDPGMRCAVHITSISSTSQCWVKTDKAKTRPSK